MPQTDETEISHEEVVRDIMDDTMKKLTVLVGKQRDGYVFRLKPSSRRRIMPQADSPGTVSSVFIAFDTAHNFVQIHGPIMEHVITLLTGRSFEDLNQAGGFTVVDRVTSETLDDSVAQHVKFGSS